MDFDDRIHIIDSMQLTLLYFRIDRETNIVAMRPGCPFPSTFRKYVIIKHV